MSDHSYSSSRAKIWLGIAMLTIIIGFIIIIADPIPSLDQTVCYRQSCNCTSFYSNTDTCIKYDVKLLYLKDETENEFEADTLVDSQICPMESGACWIDKTNDDVHFVPPETSITQGVGAIFLQLGAAMIMPIAIITCVHKD